MPRFCNEADCQKTAHYGFPADEKFKRLKCQDHKTEGMVPSGHKKCDVQDCHLCAYYGFPGDKRTKCCVHRLEGMCSLKTERVENNARNEFVRSCLITLFPDKSEEELQPISDFILSNRTDLLDMPPDVDYICKETMEKLGRGEKRASRDGWTDDDDLKVCMLALSTRKRARVDWDKIKDLESFHNINRSLSTCQHRWSTLKRAQPDLEDCLPMAHALPLRDALAKENDTWAAWLTEAALKPPRPIQKPGSLRTSPKPLYPKAASVQARVRALRHPQKAVARESQKAAPRDSQKFAKAAGQRAAQKEKSVAQKEVQKEAQKAAQREAQKAVQKEARGAREIRPLKGKVQKRV